MNEVFMLSANAQRVKYFKKYFNIFNTEHRTKISIIVDDRRLASTEIKEIRDLGYDVHLVTDVINRTVPLLSNPRIAIEILSKYGVSIKWLVFIFASKILGIKKLMMIDDDTLMLKPLDAYFEHDHVIMREFLSKMSSRVVTLLDKLYGDLCDVNDLNEKRMFLNSGQIIYSWDDDLLLEHIDRAFSELMLDFVNEGIEKYRTKTDQGIRSVGGQYWVIEQYVYAVFFQYFKEKHEVHNFKSDVKIQTIKIPEGFRLKKIVPTFIHYLPKNKDEFYDKYLPALDYYIKENGLKERT